MQQGRTGRSKTSKRVRKKANDFKKVTVEHRQTITQSEDQTQKKSKERYKTKIEGSQTIRPKLVGNSKPLQDSIDEFDDFQSTVWKHLPQKLQSLRYHSKNCEVIIELKRARSSSQGDQNLETRIDCDASAFGLGSQSRMLQASYRILRKIFN